MCASTSSILQFVRAEPTCYDGHSSYRPLDQLQLSWSTTLLESHPSIHPTDEPPTEAADHHRFSTSASSQPSMKPSDNTTLIMLNHRRKSPPWKEQWNDLYSVYMYLYHTLFIFLYLCRSASPQEKTNRMDSELNSIL